MFELFAVAFVACLALLFIIAMTCGVAALAAFPMMWAWNGAASAFSAPCLDWFTSFCILVVVSILGAFFNKGVSVKADKK